jgi:hypothetical protein
LGVEILEVSPCFGAGTRLRGLSCLFELGGAGQDAIKGSVDFCQFRRIGTLVARSIGVKLPGKTVACPLRILRGSAGLNPKEIVIAHFFLTREMLLVGKWVFRDFSVPGSEVLCEAAGRCYLLRMGMTEKMPSGCWA